MRIKASSLFIKFGRAAVLLMFLFAEFFGFGLSFQPQLAQAACPFGIQFSSDSSSVSYSSSFNLTAKVSASGSSSECGTSVKVYLSLATQSLPTGETILSQTINLSNNLATAVFNIKPQDYMIRNLPVRNQMDFWATVYNSNNSQVTKSAKLSVAITNVPGINYNLPVSVSLSNGALNFKEGDQTDVVVSVGNLSTLGSSVKKAYLALYVNNGSQPILGKDYDIPLGQSTKFTYSNFIVSGKNGFKDGPNQLIAKLYVAGTSDEIGEGSLTLQAQGLTTGSTNTKPNQDPTTTGKPNQDPTTTAKPNQDPASTAAAPAPVDCTGPNPDPKYCIYNPLPESELTPMLLAIMKGFLGIIAVWAVVFIVIGGFKMVMAQGNEEAYTTAKKTITWAILGLVIALLSFAVIAMVQNFLGTDIKPASLIQQ